MKISEILKQKGPTISFEVFPPKETTSFESVKRATEEIASLSPSFVSVTYGAGGGTSRYTLDIAQNIMQTCGVPTLAHLTCVSSTRQTVRELVCAMKEAGIKNILAMRGDLTEEQKRQNRADWTYRHATDLIADIRDIDEDFCIGAACYPEVHPESRNQEEDIFYLKAKQDAGACFFTSQMFFDNNLFYNFLYKARSAGITVPIIPGIMPITRSTQVARAIELSGSFMPQRFKSLVDRFGDDPAAMQQAGIAYATDQIIDLYANGITDVHVYTMNSPIVAEKIRANLSDILAK